MVLYNYKRVWIHDTPIASTTRVYAAWVSLSRPTTVRTIPSLKPTLNLPSWLPPKNTQHKHRSKLIYSISVKPTHSNTHSTAIILKEACSSPHTQSHTEMDGWTKVLLGAHSPHKCTTLQPTDTQKQLPLRPLTCDEVAKFCVEASVVVRAAEARYNVVSRDTLLQGNIVHGGVEGGRLIIYIQNWPTHTNTQTERHEDTQIDVHEDK